MFWPKRNLEDPKQRYGPWRWTFAITPKVCRESNGGCGGKMWLERYWIRRDYSYTWIKDHGYPDILCSLCLPLTTLANHGTGK